MWYIINMEYQRDEQRIHLIIYHLIWCPKRRKAVLVGDVAAACERLIRAKYEQQGWTVLERAVQPDHVHVFVRVYPTTTASEVVKEVKGFTAHELRAKYPFLKRLPSLWTCSYFASTAGNVSQATISAYIEAQKGM
jgi:putative transposase